MAYSVSADHAPRADRVGGDKPHAQPNLMKQGRQHARPRGADSCCPASRSNNQPRPTFYPIQVGSRLARPFDGEDVAAVRRGAVEREQLGRTPIAVTTSSPATLGRLAASYADGGVMSVSHCAHDPSVAVMTATPPLRGIREGGGR